MEAILARISCVRAKLTIHFWTWRCMWPQSLHRKFKGCWTVGKRDRYYSFRKIIRKWCNIFRRIQRDVRDQQYYFRKCKSLNFLPKLRVHRLRFAFWSVCFCFLNNRKLWANSFDAKPCLTEVILNASLSKRLPRSVWVCHTNAVLEGPIRYWKNLTERAEGRPRLRVWQIHVSWHDYVLFTIDSHGTLRQGLQWQKFCCTRIKKKVYGGTNSQVVS